MIFVGAVLLCLCTAGGCHRRCTGAAADGSGEDGNGAGRDGSADATASFLPAAAMLSRTCGPVGTLHTTCTGPAALAANAALNHAPVTWMIAVFTYFAVVGKRRPRTPRKDQDRAVSASTTRWYVDLKPGGGSRRHRSAESGQISLLPLLCIFRPRHLPVAASGGDLSCTVKQRPPSSVAG